MRASHVQQAEALQRVRTAGFTIVELMIAMTISLLILVALVGVFTNTSRTQSEFMNTNALIESGRFTLQLLEDDVVHAGFWSGYVPGFDDLSSSSVPGDVPGLVPNPCTLYSSWDSDYRAAILGIGVQTYETLPTGAGCLSQLPQRPATDVLVVRHAETCVPGEGNCEADVAGRVYFQPSFCAVEKSAGIAQASTSTSITLASTASDVDNAYVGLTLRIVAGTGAGQYRHVSAYNRSTKVATISTPWTVIPDNTTAYGFEYFLGTSSFPLHQRSCAGTGTPASLPITSGPSAEKRRYVSHMYYVTNFPHPDRAGEVIPTLVRSRFDLGGSGLAHLAPELLIEGVEAFRVELGIDGVSDSGAPVDYTAAVAWADPDNKISPTNRGDGTPDEFIRCTHAAPCTAAQLSDVVAAKLYVLARSRDRAPGHTDAKTYCLGELASDGTCPAANTIAAANDNYKRHVFSTSVRLHNVSGRRETP